MQSKATIVLMAAGFALVMAGGVSRASIVIYQDTFDRTVADLNGNQLNVAPGFTGTGSNGGSTTAQWAAEVGTFSTNGSLVTAGPTTAAYLPFTPEAGQVYTLSATMRSSGANWVALGFSNVTNFSSINVVNGFHDSYNPIAWTLLRTNGQTTFFQGPGASGGTNTTTVNGSVLNQLSIVLDTRVAGSWTATSWINGVSTGVTKTYSTWTANAVGFGDDGGDTLTADSFSLVMVPEPSCWVLLFAAASGLGVLGRRVTG